MSDLISRQAALEKVRTMQTYKLFVSDDMMILVDKAEVQTELMMLPPAQHERKRGKWLADNRPGGGFWVCSCCKFPSEAFAANVLYNFCPNCGADMGGEQDG